MQASSGSRKILIDFITATDYGEPSIVGIYQYLVDSMCYISTNDGISPASAKKYSAFGIVQVDNSMWGVLVDKDNPPAEGSLNVVMYFIVSPDSSAASVSSVSGPYPMVILNGNRAVVI
jgi:hypothetical protein